ncbi:MAG TPA: S41 family peptidase [Thermoanaerobaculia bacterium]|jgi:C-terminal processing protease CtpA/Prc|nr:S41 family peptidase [Thermoanaerobaculia bacterium]
MRSLIAALHDGHGAVFHRNPYVALTPPLAFDWIEDRLVIAWADPEKAAGIRPGDTVLSIDGKPAREVLLAAEARVSAATPQHLRLSALPSLVTGPKDQEVRLEIEPLDGPVRIVTVRCVLPYFGEGSARSSRLASLPDKIAELRPGIFYVDLGRITGADFKAALGRLAAARGVVFDLREYPNGPQEDVLQHLTGRSLYSSQFIVPLITRPDQQGVIWLNRRSTVVPLSPRLPGKVAFLAGAGTFSYGEGLLSFVEAYKLGAIVGGPSAGINGAVNQIELPGEYLLSWTDMKVLRPDGSRQYGIAIQPTVPVAPTRRGLAAGKDEVLEKGLDVVSMP